MEAISNQMTHQRWFRSLVDRARQLEGYEKSGRPIPNSFSARNLTSLTAGSPEKRVKLCLHVLGPEIELNVLPIFLFEIIDSPSSPSSSPTTTSLFASGAPASTASASPPKPQASPPPASANPSAQTTAHPSSKYAAPQEFGSSSIHIFLHGSAPHMEPSDLGKLYARTDSQVKPDALLALNAGLVSYRQWWPLFQVANLVGIPFAVTEYTEQSLEHVVNGQVGNVHTILPLNPFRQPRQRPMPAFRMPNLVNGFTMVVIDAPPKAWTYHCP
ncbi:hypothetical protein BDV98DRAFT_597524 [Pterulicium gracile]|uniref:Mitochondrial splicing suppressor 51-like C-terminal domain-containing protein n=1 Tax=Pterulicium gracile TaxID=1884261 RepID=A0A5C3Q3A9_9AGAR|nr:hypothetical protein BDV98DRAFT_597524 [Pterula gracilis]